MEKVFAELLPSELLWLPSQHFEMGKEMTGVLTATAFVIGAGVRHAQAEKGHLPSIRAHLSGTRLVVAASEEFYVMRHVASKPSFAELWRYFLNMDTKDVAEFAKRYSLVYYTLTAGDILLLPAGWVIAEDIRGHGHVKGVKKSFLLKRDKAGVEALKTIQAHLKVSGGSATTAHMIIETMLVHSRVSNVGTWVCKP